MRVENLYVIELGNDQEVLVGGEALFKKYTPRCGTSRLIAGKKGYPLPTVITQNGNAPRRRTGCGVYLVGHSTSAATGAVDMMLQYIKPEDKADLTKIALVTCHGANLSAPGLDSYQDMIIKEISTRMHVRPMVAAWNVYLTVLPCRPIIDGKERNVYGPNGKKKMDIDVTDLAGAKVMLQPAGARKVVLLGDGLRGNHKVIRQMNENGGIGPISPDLWSDREFKD